MATKKLEDMLSSKLSLNEINADPLAHDPDKFWKRLGAKKVKVESLALSNGASGKLRVVCISDTHTRQPVLPEADVLIHAGDVTMRGHKDELEEFNRYLGTLNHIKHKVVIAGNHDHLLDRGSNHFVEKSVRTLSNCKYLQDDFVVIEGVKIYGSPWTPRFHGCFQLDRGMPILRMWNKIPDDTDILVTHGPPAGYGDDIYGWSNHAGCVDLLNTVQRRVKPKFHIFGHIHCAYGIWSDGVTTFINASMCNNNYKLVNDPVIFDIDKKVS